MNDFNIIICCKLTRERVIRARAREPTGSERINGRGIFIKLYGRNGETGRARARRSVCDYRFSRAFTCEYPRGKLRSRATDRRRHAPRPETNIAVRVRTAKLCCSRRRDNLDARIASSVEIDGNGNKRRYGDSRTDLFDLNRGFRYQIASSSC